jgi:hypothetical protein
MFNLLAVFQIVLLENISIEGTEIHLTVMISFSVITLLST